MGAFLLGKLPDSNSYIIFRVHKWSLRPLILLSVRARINSWIELELIINSIQFSMNWIGIELKGFELELNWNWKPELIGIDQFNQFIFNSTPHFTRLNFFVCHIMEIAEWQVIPCKQVYPVPTCSIVCSQFGFFRGLRTWRVDHCINYFEIFPMV